MSGSPIQPRLTGDGQVTVTRRELLTFDCPNCKESLNITGLAFGTTIACPNCGNVTWTPEWKPRWWFTARNFILSLILAFFIGVFSSLVANVIWHRLTNSPTQQELEKGN